MRLDLPSKLGLAALALVVANPMFGAEEIDESKAIVEKLTKAVESHNCPAQLDYQKDIPPQCPPANCTKDGKLDQKCTDDFWACHQRRTDRMEANNKYNSFLRAECTIEAKNRKAQEAADAARKQAKDIEDDKQQRDKKITDSSSCFTTRDLCTSACTQQANTTTGPACDSQCKEGAYTLHCFKKP